MPNNRLAGRRSHELAVGAVESQHDHPLLRQMKVRKWLAFQPLAVPNMNLDEGIAVFNLQQGGVVTNIQRGESGDRPPCEPLDETISDRRVKGRQDRDYRHYQYSRSLDCLSGFGIDEGEEQTTNARDDGHISEGHQIQHDAPPNRMRSDVLGLTRRVPHAHQRRPGLKLGAVPRHTGGLQSDRCHARGDQDQRDQTQQREYSEHLVSSISAPLADSFMRSTARLARYW